MYLLDIFQFPGFPHILSMGMWCWCFILCFSPSWTDRQMILPLVVSGCRLADFYVQFRELLGKILARENKWHLLNGISLKQSSNGNSASTWIGNFNMDQDFPDLHRNNFQLVAENFIFVLCSLVHSGMIRIPLWWGIQNTSKDAQIAGWMN